MEKEFQEEGAITVENENKEMQGGVNEAELEEKVLQDVSEKIAEAAAELEEEIAEAEAVAEETVEEYFGEDADELDAEDGEYAEIEEEELAPEPKWITLKLRNLVMALVGTAVAGALLLLLGMQVPTWVDSIPEGKKVATVDGTVITDADMEGYIYEAATEFFRKNGGVVTSASEYDWSTKTEDGRTAEEVVKEQALEKAIQEAVTMNMGEMVGLDWSKKATVENVKLQVAQMESIYGKEMVHVNGKAQGIRNSKQYRRKTIQAQHISAVETDILENPNKYYPEDKDVLKDYPSTVGASVKHILVSTDAKEGEEVNKEEKKALAEELLGRIKAGEDFEALVAEYNDDPGQTEEGYTFGPGQMVEAFEDATFALKVGEISDVVETNYGYHIIKRIAGINEVKAYWKAQAKIKVKEKAIAKMSVEDIMEEAEESAEEFEELYSEYQQKQ